MDKVQRALNKLCSELSAIKVLAEEGAEIAQRYPNVHLPNMLKDIKFWAERSIAEIEELDIEDG